MKKVLIAEDDETILQLIDYRLIKLGYETVAVNDGKSAMIYLENNKVDALITDLMMPYISGLELISYLRNTLKYNTPIIVLSGSGLEQVVLEAFELGADDFMTKPFSPDELILRLNRLLK
ncbi:MAG: response regulator transcription factor [Pseudarcicella sp.]|nr:response regulator transcription factor [Pseudarcicella sp.]MBP6411392.1 response regulator transcription factor [Pseudarcicella sp.]